MKCFEENQCCGVKVREGFMQGGSLVSQATLCIDSSAIIRYWDGGDQTEDECGNSALCLHQPNHYWTQRHSPGE